MNFYEVAPTKIIRSGVDSFTYSSQLPLKTGSIVLIEVGRKTMTGIILKKVNEPSYTTKEIIQLIYPLSLPLPLIKTALWISEYYATPLALVLQSLLPRGINKKRRSLKKLLPIPMRDRTKIVFNKEQVSAISTILNQPAGTFLLQGVTGSGKTEVYKAIAKDSLDKHKSVIILTPEIGLTPQLLSEFSKEFSNIIITHSTMTEAERHHAWEDALQSDTPRIVIGPRSALFSPLNSVGAIIIDEAHEPSYKQEQSPKYSALRVATILGRHHEAKVIFGSATPSVTDRYVAENTPGAIVTLSHRARPQAKEPTISMVDMKKREEFGTHRFLSKKLLTAIEHNISSGKQTLIFHNRRGSAATTLCDNCGWTALCPNCFIPLTLHADKYRLQCHICNHIETVPSSCPLCQHTDIIHKGIGTKLIESELQKLFPTVVIGRFDSDTDTDNSMQKLYEKLYNGEIHIAIGTQIVAKGLDLPHLHTVGIVQADSGLLLPDFTSEERAFQLLSQVIGRVGRYEHDTEVIIQSYQPTHPSIIDAMKQDYESFYQSTLTSRKAGGFPPFTYLLKLTCSYKTEAAAIRAAQQVARDLRPVLNGMQLLGPTPSFYERSHDQYRWQLIIKSKKREQLISLLPLIPSQHWQFDLDPSSLL